jgi:hypothetical protein
MQRICVWPKIWTLSGKLSLMRTVQLMKKNIYTQKNVICSQQLEICKSVCMFIVLAIALWRLINFRLFYSDDCRSWPREETFWFDDCRSRPREEKINNHECWGKHAPFSKLNYQGKIFFTQNWCNITWNNTFSSSLQLYSVNKESYAPCENHRASEQYCIWKTYKRRHQRSSYLGEVSC